MAPITSRSVLDVLAGLPPDRFPNRAGHERARTFLKEHLERLGLPVIEQPYHWPGAPDVTFVNLEVRLPAAAPGAPILVACAHYDTVPRTPGADDNGSGVAALLEVARRLGARRLASEVRLLWFDGEELGMTGSRAWINALSDAERTAIVGAIDLESIGYRDLRPGSQSMPPGTQLLQDLGDVGDFVLVLGNQRSAALADVVGLALAAESGPDLRVEVFSRLPGEGWVIPDSRRSDHASFWDVGIAAVMLGDTANFRNPHYHEPTDRIETLDGAFLAAVARGVERALLLLSEESL